jgi:amyloid beta precursor protein binding protein 1
MATSDKYDRQLRLWGASGQRALQESKIVLIHATAVGTETLKNLVLPGIGSFHIYDDGSNHDAYNAGMIRRDNFFANYDSEQTADVSRAQTAMEQLLELNPDCRGSFTHVPSLATGVDYSAVLTKEETTLVLCADLPSCPLLTISNICQERGIPLVICKSYGLIGSVRLQVADHLVVDSRPDHVVPDLRLAPRPFATLNTWISQNFSDLKSFDNAQHGHVPQIVILTKALDIWRSQLQDIESTSIMDSVRLPATVDEKQAFRDTIKSMARNFDMELNFQEAHSEAYLAYTPRELPWEVQDLIATAQQNTSDKSKWMVLLRALGEFMNTHQDPPLHGSIPDMTSSTSWYVELQTIYQTKAAQDVAYLKQLVLSQDANLGRTMTDEDIETFCKNVFSLHRLQTRSFAEEYQQWGSSDTNDASEDAMETNHDNERMEDLQMVMMDPYEQPEHTPLLWHIALRACDMYRDVHGEYPGEDSDSLTTQATEVHQSMLGLVQKMGLEMDHIDLKPHAAEMVRYHNAQVHNVASIIGGVASQEAVKLITCQYIPLNNTHVYNGIAGTAAVYRF